MKWLPYVLAITSGASLPLAFAPLAIWPLVILAPAALLFCVDQSLQQNQKSRAIKQAYLFAFGFYGVGVSWVYVSIHVYGYTPAPIAAFLALLFAASLALVNALHIYCYIRFDWHRNYVIAFPASWVVFEWFRSWFLTGFPWLYNGYALIDSPLASIANLGGVYTLSFISILLAALLLYLFKNVQTIGKNKKTDFKLLASVAVVFLIFIAAFFNDKQQWSRVDYSKPIHFELVQGNISQHDKWLPENQRKILRQYGDLIQSVFDRYENSGTPVVIVLPEAAMPTFQSQLAWFFDALDKQGKQGNAAIISGIFYDEDMHSFESEKVYNSILAVGQGDGLYHKQRLVPFGEYVPLEKFIRGAIPFFDLPFSSFTRGKQQQPGLQAFSYKIAPFICYEILYPELVYQQGKDADILLTISNDAWFGSSSGPDQHFQMARMRALELGKYLVRTTNTGTTAVINHKGHVVKQLPNFETAILSEQAFLTTGKTPFSHWGHRPVLIFSGLICIFLLTMFLKNQFLVNKNTKSLL